jgi:cytochrome c oxidase assembly protein subunit 15
MGATPCRKASRLVFKPRLGHILPHLKETAMSTVLDAVATPAARSGASTRSPDTADRRLIRIWLGVVIFSLHLSRWSSVGGATRLTESGLSITEWKPIHGVDPAAIRKSSGRRNSTSTSAFRNIRKSTRGCRLDEFKTIFWWEWAHRFLARGDRPSVRRAALAFFWLTGRIEKGLRSAAGRSSGAWVAFQGFIGWWMVSSGLTERTSDVSQYRLATHLTIACLIFAAIVWIMRSVSRTFGRSAADSEVALAAAGGLAAPRSGSDLSRRARCRPECRLVPTTPGR